MREEGVKVNSNFSKWNDKHVKVDSEEKEVLE